MALELFFAPKHPTSVPLQRTFLIVALACIYTFRVAAQTSINLSHDLVPLGIAAQNMVPNTPTLDSQPLFTAAIQYAQANGVHLVTADSGAYYFLTSQNDYIYLIFGNLSDLTIDFQGSTLYFQYGLLRAIEMDSSQRVTWKNFTIDSLVPRFTQVQLTAVDPVKGTLSYTVPQGWADPASFTTSVLGTPQLFAFFFRNGLQAPATALTFISYPITSPTLTITNNGEPWTQLDVLSTLRPGDTVAVWDRSGLEAISVDSSDSITLSNIEVHGSGGGFAVAVGRSSNSVADNVRIKPRPGALVASNADGIHFYLSLRNNHIRNCYVTRTTDDAIAMESGFVASVVSQPGPRQLVMTRDFNNRVSNGTMVNFVPLATAAEVSGAGVVSQDPPDSPDVGMGGQFTVTFDRDLPGLSPGDEMTYASADMRGSGSSIEDNVIEKVPGRIYLGGLENVIVQRNVIRRASNSAINVSEVTVPAGGGGVPSHGVTIQDNVIEHVLGPQASGAGGAYVNQAAIIVSSNDLNFDFVPQPVNTNISVLNNYIADSGRAGIWIGELNGGTVSGNVVTRWNEYPNLPVWGDAPFPQDFAQPLVVRYSQDVNTAGNIFQAQSNLSGAVSLSPSAAHGDPEGGSGSFTLQANVPGFGWSAISDSSWLTVTEGGSGTGNGAVQYSVAPNDSGLARTGAITVAGVSFRVIQCTAPTPTESAATVTEGPNFGAHLRCWDR